MISIGIKFRPQDWLIGVFWFYTQCVIDYLTNDSGRLKDVTTIYIFIIPCFPIVITYNKFYMWRN